jgi:DNA-binding transcriptional regulator LsrR (DeoR family)
MATERKLLEIARLYYRKKQTLEEIGEKLGLSAVHVGRLLKQAEATGIVQFNINIVAPREEELRAELLEHFDSLKDAVVISSSDDFTFEREMCAQATADYLDKLIKLGIKSIAVGGGNTLYEMVIRLPGKKREIDIYPTAIIGRGPTITLPDRTVIISLLWAKSGEKAAIAHYASVLPLEKDVPLKDVKKEYKKFLKRSTVNQVYEGMKGVECVITTLGPIEENIEYAGFSPQTTLRKLNAMEIIQRDLKAQRLAGEVSYNYFDSEGNTRPEWQFGISLGVDHLKKMVSEDKWVVVVAGKYKEVALKAALKGRLLNVLITDARTASNLLAK